MGYCHALDRPLQMLMMRVLGQGRAAELLDGTDEMVEVDRFFRRMNWAGRMSEQVAALSPETRALAGSYCDGVNARFARGAPLELKLLGVRAEPWRVEDCLLLSRMAGYLTLAQSQAEVERLFVQMVQAGVPDAHLDALFPGCTAELDRALLESVTLGERVVPEGVLWGGAAPRAMASNNWVVAGRKTASGRPMLGNDPHLEVNRLPNVWCEQSYRWPGGWLLAVGMPGLPAALVGRSAHLAWGATYTFMDAVDSWVEDCRDGCFRRGDEWVPFEVRTERVLRKGADPIDLVFHENVHGALDGDPDVSGRYLATRWASSDSGARSLDAAAAMFGATSVAEGMRHLGRIETAWNWVVADREGIGYQMSGRMPRRAEGVSGFVPRPGWDPAFDWQGYVEPERLPRCVDPSDGFVVTANQDLNGLGEADPINRPMGDYRARRIADLLAARDDHDRASFAAIQRDVRSIQVEPFLARLRPHLPDTPAARCLLDWDHGYAPDSRGAAVFEAFYRALCAEMFGATLGAPVVEHLLESTGVFIDFYQDFDRCLLDPGSPWLDGRDQAEVFARAFEQVAHVTPRPWGETNQVVLRHMLLGDKLPRWAGFDRGPITLRGGRATPHQGQIYRSGDRLTSFAPSLRLVADLADDALWTALCGGPSDRRFSRWYASGVTGWAAGQYVKRTPPEGALAPVVDMGARVSRADDAPERTLVPGELAPDGLTLRMLRLAAGERRALRSEVCTALVVVAGAVEVDGDRHARFDTRLLASGGGPTLHNPGPEVARVVVVGWAAEHRRAGASGRFADTRPIRHRFPLRWVPSAFRDVLSPRDLHLLLGPRGGRMRYAVTGPDALLVALASTPPGTGPALHVHTRSHEVFVVCEGRFRVRWGDAGEHEAVLEPFDVAAFPPGVNRTFENAGGEANWILPIVVGANDELEDIVWLPPIRDALRRRLPAAVVAVATRTVLKIRPRAALGGISRPG